MILEVRASDLSEVRTIGTRNTPRLLAFDGSSIWAGGSTSDLVRVNIAPPVLSSSNVSLGRTRTVAGLGFDGANIWVTTVPGVTFADGTDNTIDFGEASTQIIPVNGGGLAHFVFNGGNGPLAFDGANMWITSAACATCPANILKIRASDQQLLGSFPIGQAPQGVAFDGANIWVAFQGSPPPGVASFTRAGGVMKLRASDGSQIGVFPAGTSPKSVAFDGANMWVLSLDQLAKM